MIVKDLIKLLDENKDAALFLMLGSGEAVPVNFHVTEVGRVEKTFIDCGGTRRESVSCLLQVWSSHDADHRLGADKLAKILRLGVTVLGVDDLPVEVEYGINVASQYSLLNVEVFRQGTELWFVLVGKKTDCLAPDKCGVSSKCCV